MSMKNLARRLKVLRAERDWTQEELSERSGVPLWSIRDYERGDTCPRLDKAAAIADAFEVSIDALLEPLPEID